MDDDQSFEKNLDDCKDLGMELWVPGRYIALRKLKVNCNGHKMRQLDSKKGGPNLDFWPKNGTKSTLDLLIHGRDNFLHSPFVTKVQWAKNEILMDTTKIWSRVSTTGLKMANDFLKVPSIRYP